MSNFVGLCMEEQLLTSNSTPIPGHKHNYSQDRKIEHVFGSVEAKAPGCIEIGQA
jgi:hypothetical protein